MELIFASAFLISLWLLFCAWQNILLFEKVPGVPAARKKWPKVSILVPARNEDKRIRPLLESLLRQDYPDYEILVLDDRSTDRTMPLLRSYARQDKRLRVFAGKELPVGWLGKPWACHQLSAKAKGDWLLFTDADTWHDPDMLKRSVHFALNRDADVLSLMNEQVTETWMEKLVVPVMVYSLVAYLPGAWALNPRSFFRKFAGVGGQFILVREKAYWATGGHGAVKNEIVEDLSLGRALVRGGFRVLLGDGSGFTHCRMYGSAREVWEGFSKNMFPAAGFSVPRMAGVLGVLLGIGMAPYLLLFLGPDSKWFFPALTLACAQWCVRWFQAWHYKMSRVSVLFHPLGSFLFALIGLNSARWFMTGGGRWKGRSLKR